MEERLIYGGEATLEDLYRLHMLGYEFVIEDGQITNVLPNERKNFRKTKGKKR